MTKINEINLPITLELQLSPESIELLANLQSLVPQPAEPTLTRTVSTRFGTQAPALSALITAEEFELAVRTYNQTWNSIAQKLLQAGGTPRPGTRSKPAMAAALRSLGIEVQEPTDG